MITYFIFFIMLLLPCLTFLLGIGSVAPKPYKTLLPACLNPIYCYGDILHHVQMKQVFKDGKTFVDLKMVHSYEETFEKFGVLMQVSDGKPTREQLIEFVNSNFERGDELLDWNIPDFNKRPVFVSNIKNTTIRNFAQDVIEIWPILGRKVKPEILENFQGYSLIPVPNGFIIPGGRFNEYYYWDSYWVIDGLLLNEMVATARGMIENFIYLADQLGYIPNGGRIYYLGRSQPPLLTPMAYLYYKTTNDIAWIETNIASLDKELTYWETKDVEIFKNGVVHHLYHYNAKSLGPRPESYREDYLTAGIFDDENKRQEVFNDIKSGAESGWDFSNRWVFDDDGGNHGNLSNIETRRVVPVDLNSFLCLAFKQISEMYSIIHDSQKSAAWKLKYLKLQKSVAEVLFNEEDGIWYDYDLKLGKHRRIFYPSNLTPLWAQCIENTKASQLGKSALDYLRKSKVLQYPGGIPSSLDTSGEQWDFPNAWAPLQDIVVRGLQNSNNPDAQAEAKILAERWVNANLKCFQEHKKMFEKYNVIIPGKFGGGGEYEVQPGFGFTNGVALRFIHDFYT